MRKFVFILTVCLMFSFCGTNKPKVDRIIEDGVEVVQNRLKPYVIKGEANVLTLEPHYTLDLERDDLSELGMSDIIGFDVDSESNHYFWTNNTSENYIYKFDEGGNFVKSFGRKGQGPGEIEEPNFFSVNDRDTISVSDRWSHKLLLLDTDGILIKEIPLASRDLFAVHLSNDYILVLNRDMGRDPSQTLHQIILRNTDLEAIQTLHKGEGFTNLTRAQRINGLNAFYNSWVWNICRGHFNWGISQGKIYVPNEENGYEFLIFSLEGKLLRKIRKEFIPVEVSRELKKRVMEKLTQEDMERYKLKEKIYFPSEMPPFQYYFMDDESRLYVMTCEKGQHPKEYIYDIFNPDGVFIGRTALNNFGTPLYAFRELPLQIVAKNGRLYQMQIKESGYLKLVVYKMNWKSL